MLKQGDAVAELVIENPLGSGPTSPSRIVSTIALGQAVRVAVASHPGTTFDGKVARINPAVDPVSRTFQVEAVIPNSRGLLRPGGFAKASIITDKRRHGGGRCRSSSVIKFAGVTKLFVVEGPRARSINVETGLEGSGWIEVVGAFPPRTHRSSRPGQTQLADDNPRDRPARPKPPRPLPLLPPAQSRHRRRARADDRGRPVRKPLIQDKAAGMTISDVCIKRPVFTWVLSQSPSCSAWSRTTGSASTSSPTSTSRSAP